MTAEFSMANDLTMVNRLIIVLGKKFCLSMNSNTRKGGLLGLGAVMVGFKNGSDSEPPPEIVEEVIGPILTCFLDSDPRVRYFACESLYNVTKVAKANALPHFESIFDNLTRIVADPDLSVRSGAELLDRLLKDIVVEQQNVDIHNFLPKFEEYLYTKNPFTRTFIISWIRLLDSRIDMITYLPKILDGIFNCLSDPADEIRALTLSLLAEFLNKIVSIPTDRMDLRSLIIIVLKHVRDEREDVVQYTAIAWLRQLIRLLEDRDLVDFSPQILGAILPCLAIISGSEESLSPTRDLCAPYIPSSPSRGNICEISSLVNSFLLEQVTRILIDRRNTQALEPVIAELEPIFDVLIQELEKQEQPVIRLTILDWLKKLKNAEPSMVLNSIQDRKLFNIILETLSDKSDQVVKSALRVIADIFCSEGSEDQQVTTTMPSDDSTSNTKEEGSQESEAKRSILQRNTSGPKKTVPKKVAIAASGNKQSSDANVDRLVQALYQTFHDRGTVFDDRGTFIILNLCSMMKPETIYRSFAEILKDEKNDTKFAYSLVQKLNQILLTTQPLFGLRSRLSNENDPEVVALFQVLYQAWCHSSIAVITLCLLTNNHRQASELVAKLSQTDVNVEILTQIDWVVQLIESPVFASLRMRLLDPNNNQHLLQTLFGLLMILPQSEAYRRLGNRLDQVYKYMCIQPQFKGVSNQVTTRQNPTGGR